MICADSCSVVQCKKFASASAVAGVGNADRSDSAGHHAVIHEAVGDLVICSKFKVAVDGCVDGPVVHLWRIGQTCSRHQNGPITCPHFISRTTGPSTQPSTATLNLEHITKSPTASWITA